jgi:hydrogenase expression/formation protein HypD
VKLMEVCGTHTVSAFRCGLHGLLPENVQLLSGPGCPVCVTAQGEIDLFIEVGQRQDVTLCTYGDMIRVTGSGGSLEKARSRGADVRVIYSAMDAVRLAAAEPGRQVVLAAVGFETTTPATAVAILEAQRLGLDNFSALVSHKLIMPAMHALLGPGQVNVAGFMLPGHVSIITGYEIFRPIPERYGLPCVVAGFEDVQVVLAVARLVEMVRDGLALLENQYPQAVRAEGNEHAKRAVQRIFEPVDTAWRGVGVLPKSGLGLREEFARFDARRRFELTQREVSEPPGCRCGDVITGRKTPAECGLFGKLCTPMNPVGPCMVSSEGTCQAWFKYGGTGILPVKTMGRMPMMAH